MAEVVVFDHAHGRTSGVAAFANELERASHTVPVSDLYDGRTFDDLDTGVGYAQQVGFDTITERGVRAVDGLPQELVHAGFSLGVLPAQKLAQTRPGAVGALLIRACVPPSEFGGPWPQDVPLHIHAMDADAFFVDEGDLDAARDLVSTAEHADLFLYPGDRHLFADPSLPTYNDAAATLLVERLVRFLDAFG